MTAPSVTYSLIVANLDPRLSEDDRRVLALIGSWRYTHDLDECVRAGDVTLDWLCDRGRGVLSRPAVFAAVARLEDLGLIPTGAVR